MKQHKYQRWNVANLLLVFLALRFRSPLGCWLCAPSLWFTFGRLGLTLLLFRQNLVAKVKQLQLQLG